MISPSKRRAAGTNKPNHSKRNKTELGEPMDLDPAAALLSPSHRSRNDASNASRTSTVLDLHRLLHVMETDPSPTVGTTTTTTARDLLLRADLLREQFQLHQNPPELAERVEAAYQAAQRAALTLQQQQQAQAQPPLEEDPVQKIFFPKTGTAHVHPEEDDTTEKSHSHNQPMDNDQKPAATTAIVAAVTSPLRRTPPLSQNVVAPTTTTNVQALQQQQRDQMEQAVAAMAQQMKDQTAQIHAQLKQQTVTLTDLEDVATQNVESVTNVAQRTQQHNRRAWGKTIGKWTLLFTVMAAFVACLLTISMVPKRPNACLFFCKSQQQFCRTNVHGKQECLDGTVTAATPAVTQETTTTQSGQEPPVVEMVASRMVRDEDQPPIQASFKEIQPVVEEETNGDIYDAEEHQEEYKQTEDEVVVDEEYIADVDVEETEPLPHQDPVYRQAAHAAATGDFKELRRILKERPDLLNLQDGNGWTLLMEASRNGKTEAVRILLTLQANTLMETYEGRHTALNLARDALGEEHMVVTLLQHYVAMQQAQLEAESVKDDIGAQQQECQLGMDGDCLSTNAADTEPVEEQHQQVPPASTEEMPEETLREYYAQQQNYHERNHDEILDEEEAHNEYGDDDDDDDDIATEPLEFESWQVRDAAERGDYDEVSHYIRESQSTEWLEEGDVNGWNALHLAVRSGHEAIVELLLTAGVNAQLETNSGSTALDMAVQQYGEEHFITELLIQYQ